MKKIRFLLFSDLHADRDKCKNIVKKAKHADIVIGAGDYALFRKHLTKILSFLSGITAPTILVHGNHETNSELVAACRKYNNFHVLHGNTITLNNLCFAGLGAGVPCTPFGEWSVDLSEKQAYALLPDIQTKYIFISHSPPYSYLDQLANGQHLGSKTILNYIKESKPEFAVCGHIHEHSGKCETIGNIPIINAGPDGYLYDYELQ